MHNRKRNGMLAFIATRGTANAEWPSDVSIGLAICTAVCSQYDPRRVRITDGYVVLRQDARDVNNDIYAQKSDVNGNMKWRANGSFSLPSQTILGHFQTRLKQRHS